MTDMRFALMSMMIITSTVACGGGPAKSASTAAAQTSPAPAAPADVKEASAAVPDIETVTGSVAETLNASGYTYVRLQTDKGELWVAVSEFPVKKGERLTVPLETPMENFHSKTLNRDFPLIYFVSQIAREGESLAAPAPQTGAPAMMGSRQAAAGAASAPTEPIPPPPGGLSIADVWAKRASLGGTPVVVRGKVVKVNNGIMDRNWIHLQDGTGSAADRTNDLTVTTSADVKAGDVVTMSGVLASGKDFGSGYAYDAILEQATVTGK